MPHDYPEAAATLTELVALATEGPASEPDLVAACRALDPDTCATVLTVAAAVITDDRHQHDTMLAAAGTANRDLRDTMQVFRDQATAYATGLVQIVRTSTDQHAVDTAQRALDHDA